MNPPVPSESAGAIDPVLTVLQSAPSGCLIWENNRPILCNGKAAAFFGAASQEALLQDFLSLIPSDQSEQLGSLLNQCLAGTLTLRTVAGQPISLALACVPFPGKPDQRVMHLRPNPDDIQRARIMLEACPLCCNFWDESLNNIDCNQEAPKLFDLRGKAEYLAHFFDLSPEYQPDGRLSVEKAREKVREAFQTGRCQFEWLHQNLSGQPIPTEITLVRVQQGGPTVVAGYTQDLRRFHATLARLEQLQAIAYIDSLTGAYTRRYFTERVHDLFQRHTSKDPPISLIMFDLDLFKHINDTWGHMAGDAVLEQVAARVRQRLSPQDLLCRYGGEEFIVLAPGSGLSQGMALAEQMRQAVSVAPISHQGHRIPVTISLGIAVKSRAGQTVSQLIDQADRALYRAKRAGRNHVCG